MAWEDMGLYWAWRGGQDGYTPTPTKKEIVYRQIGGMRIACAVIEGGKTTPVYQEEIKRLLRFA